MIDLGTLSFLGIVNDRFDTNILYWVIEIAKNSNREFGQSVLLLITLSFSLERLERSSRAPWRVSWLGNSIDTSLIEISNFLLLRNLDISHIVLSSSDSSHVIFLDLISSIDDGFLSNIGLDNIQLFETGKSCLLNHKYLLSSW